MSIYEKIGKLIKQNKIYDKYKYNKEYQGYLLKNKFTIDNCLQRINKKEKKNTKLENQMNLFS